MAQYTGIVDPRFPVQNRRLMSCRFTSRGLNLATFLPEAECGNIFDLYLRNRNDLNNFAGGIPRMVNMKLDQYA